MNFYFPGTSDLIDPGYNFETERHDPHLPRRDYWYPHQIFDAPPYDGMLISKSLVDPSMSSKSSVYRRWRRLKAKGGRKYLHFDKCGYRLLLMGDCGAYSYSEQETPPITTKEAIDFYSRCEVDFGLSVDHIISGFTNSKRKSPPSESKRRYQITLNYAREFWDLTKKNKVSFHPIGVTQGWDASSYAEGVESLQRIGYDYIALGGLSRLSLTDLSVCLEAIRTVRRSTTRLHLLGITPIPSSLWTRRWGVQSFDCTTPFRQAFLNEKDNYYTPQQNYLAIRVPKVEENREMRRHISAENLSFREARSMEQECLQLLRSYDRREASIREVLDALSAYELIFNERDHREQYQHLLRSRSWEECPCQICKDIGIGITLLRDKQRNNRRGFHNLLVFNQNSKN